MVETAIKIGDEFFVFDENKRVYEAKNSPPTYRGHFRPITVTGETSRSWIVGPFGMKVSKKDPWSVLYTPSMIDDGEWVNSHRYKLEYQLRMATAEQLRAIADILGYES